MSIVPRVPPAPQFPTADAVKRVREAQLGLIQQRHHAVKLMAEVDGNHDLADEFKVRSREELRRIIATVDAEMSNLLDRRPKFWAQNHKNSAWGRRSNP